MFPQKTNQHRQEEAENITNATSNTYWVTESEVKTPKGKFRCVVCLAHNAVEVDAQIVPASNPESLITQYEKIVAVVPQADKLAVLASLCARDAVAQFLSGQEKQLPPSNIFVDLAPPPMVKTGKVAVGAHEVVLPKFAKYCDAWVWQA